MWIDESINHLLFTLFISSKIQLNYSAVLYLFYDSKLAEICKSIIIEVCNNIKRLDVPDDQFEYLPNLENVNMGTTLFEVYLILKRYVQLGKVLKSSLLANH